jgi:hypothetical protein
MSRGKLGNDEIFEISTVHSEVFSSLKSGKGDRRRVVTDNGELFHACIVSQITPDVKPLLYVFLLFYPS